jgi:hypothetical protein
MLKPGARRTNPRKRGCDRGGCYESVGRIAYAKFLAPIRERAGGEATGVWNACFCTLAKRLPHCY